MKPWEELRKKQSIEVKELLEMFSHLTIVEASRAMGIDSHALRTHAFRFGVELRGKFRVRLRAKIMVQFFWVK